MLTQSEAKFEKMVEGKFKLSFRSGTFDLPFQISKVLGVGALARARDDVVTVVKEFSNSSSLEAEHSLVLMFNYNCVIEESLLSSL